MIGVESNIGIGVIGKVSTANVGGNGANIDPQHEEFIAAANQATYDLPKAASMVWISINQILQYKAKYAFNNDKRITFNPVLNAGDAVSVHAI